MIVGGAEFGLAEFGLAEFGLHDIERIYKPKNPPVGKARDRSPAPIF